MPEWVHAERRLLHRDAQALTVVYPRGQRRERSVTWGIGFGSLDSAWSAHLAG